MAIITLTSDWGTRDHYTASVKGAILRQLPDAVIVDISHAIQPYNLNQAAFIVRNSYRNFPEGTIHILCIIEEASIESPHTLVFQDGHYFIGADNGIFSLIFDQKPEQVIELDVIQDSNYFTFPGRDVFAKVACHIAQGKPITELGHPKKSVMEKLTLRPVVDPNYIKGVVIYNDNYGNAYTNITESLFSEVVQKRKFAVTFLSRNNNIRTISKSFMDVPPGEMLALFAATGHLVIAQRNSKASELLGLKPDVKVTVEIE
jgi:S-adenosyl-L-methionine hydrolase (adenosine-forming)